MGSHGSQATSPMRHECIRERQKGCLWHEANSAKLLHGHGESVMWSLKEKKQHQWFSQACSDNCLVIMSAQEVKGDDGKAETLLCCS